MSTQEQTTPEGTQVVNEQTPEVKPADLNVGTPEPTIKPTGDAALDIALTFFAKQGIAENSLAMTQAQAGDFSLLKAELAAKGAAGWEQYTAIAEQAAAREAAAAEASKAAALKVVVDVCGSQEAWAAVKEVIASKASEAELQQINQGLRAGGLVAKATAEYMKRVAEAAGVVPAAVQPQGRVVNSARTGTAAPKSALSPREYADAVAELARKVGAGRVDSTPEYAQLKARRLAYRG